MAGRVYTIPASEPFLVRLAQAILMGHLPARDGTAPHPLDLPGITILLPTRRAARALQSAFLGVSGATALLLPRIKAIAEGEEDLSLIAGLAGGGNGLGVASAADDVFPAVGELERRLVLTQLVLAWSDALRSGGADTEETMARRLGSGGSTPAQAAQLAAELSRLMDMIETEQATLADLGKLVPDAMALHWQQTVDFLEIVTRSWPAYLAGTGMQSRAARTNALLSAEAQRLAANPPTGPVIVAGVTGSIPAAADLMAVVARLDQGAIVLPGLDQALDGETWDALVPDHPEHPQFGLKRLLDRIGVRRDDVEVLAGAEPSAGGAARLALISQMLRPADSTSAWHDYTATVDRDGVRRALSGVTRIAAPSAQDEAEVAALILREAAETPGRTAALVSPDRVLARRVLARLDTWGIRGDDSAGRPFRKTVAGTLFDLVADAVATEFAPAAVVALLRHPLARFGLDIGTARRAARALEIAVFRTAYLGRGLAGIEQALDTASVQSREGGERRGRAVRRLHDDHWAAARDIVTRLRTALEPLETMFADPQRHPLQTLAAAHVAAVEAVAAAPDRDDNPIWDEEAGRTASQFFAGLLDERLLAPAIPARDYPDLYRTLVASEAVRPRVPVHPRIFIWGPYEARLQQADVLVLGSLNEGTWPEAADPGPWLNRPMRAALGLPSPEEDIGRAAHDFAALAAAPQVYLTRAEKVDGVPTVPSRWLLRLDALLAGMDLENAVAPQQPWLSWARARDRILARKRIGAPRPKPAVEQRPRRMSVTKVETWMANPYAVFASDVLRLEPLPPLGQPPDAALRGAVIHAALGRFAERYPDTLPDDVAGELDRIAATLLAEMRPHPRVAAFWLPRFQRFAKWFAETELERRKGTERVHAEVTAAHVFDAPFAPFTLTARADRIDAGRHGLVITDYKTGTPPSDTEVLAGIAPQLPLEAALAAEGAFANVPQGKIAGLRYIRASGGEPAGVERMVKTDDATALGRQALEKLARLVALYDDPQTPYSALRRPRYRYDYDAFAHLARVKEWSGEDEEEAA